MASTRNNQRLEDLARLTNPAVRGWMNYYGRLDGDGLDLDRNGGRLKPKGPAPVGRRPPELPLAAPPVLWPLETMTFIAALHHDCEFRGNPARHLNEPAPSARRKGAEVKATPKAPLLDLSWPVDDGRR
jgi:hypothetical protein